ncbi:spore germination protein [Metabacillus sp. GX 13764]|uniref:spore germination protein n=1 Tax=Metabacillus kandeliae TaxID=2900151 RepID=UPI001E4BEC09|nr:spore germination protein [Metabacillus kandeliae]MCD7032917.1 spore germination protein [Metabacillus kandeliae]
MAASRESKTDVSRLGTEHLAEIPVNKQIKANFDELQKIFGSTADLKTIVYHFPNASIGFVHLEGLTDRAQLEEMVILPIQGRIEKEAETDFSAEPEKLQQAIAVTAEIMAAHSAKDLSDSLLSGHALMFIEGVSFAYTLPIQSWKTRSIEEPVAQTMVRGPREGFVESLSTNMSLLRRRITSPSLHFKQRKIGKLTKTNLLLCYIDGLAEPEILETITKRLDELQIDKIFDTGMLEELLEDKGYTPFPVFQATERPDVTAAALAEGKVAIMLEGTPFALIVPVTFWSFFQAAEDYYTHYELSTFVRVIRMLSYFIALSLPAIFIALITFQPELIPSALLVSLAAQREGIPFPAFVEALLMEMIFEILREAGIRMPRAIGSAVSIVGAIVIGESAVAAGLVSPAIVIVVSLTAIASFVSPYYSFSGAARMLRFLLMVVASTLGIFGMIIFLFMLITHLCSVTSLGKPYFAPLAPFSFKEQKDVLFRLPLWWSETKLYKSYMKRRAKGG